MRKLNIVSGSLDHYYYFEEQIRELVKAQKSNYLALLPVNRAVRLFKKQLIDGSPGQVLADPPVFTFDGLLLQLYRSLPGARRIISNDMLLFFIEDILRRKKDEFAYLSISGMISSGLVKKTAEMIAELRRFGYDGEHFGDVELSEKKDNPLKYNDFELLLRELDHCLGRQLIDEPFALHCAAQELTGKYFEAVFPGVEHIYISGYGLFTPAMYSFIEKSSLWCEVNLKLDHTARNASLFRHTEQALQRFRAMGAQIINPDKSSPLAEKLFNRSLAVSAEDDFSERIAVQALQDREEEIRFIAASIRKKHLEEKIPLHKFAVTFSNMEKYVPRIRRLFGAYGLPFNLSTGFNLQQSPLVRIFLNVLRLIESGFDSEKTLQLLSSFFIKKDTAFNTSLLRRLFAEQRIRRLHPGWQKHLRLPDTQSDDRENPDAEINPRAQVQNLEQLLQHFYHFPQQAAVNDFRTAYVELLKKLGLLDWYRHPAEHLTERQHENEFRAYNRFMKLFDKLIWTLNYLHGNNPIPLAEFSRHLLNAVQGAVYNLTEPPEYGVQIMPRLEVQALDFEVLFIGGLVDGEFPRASSRDVFFNDGVRAKMGLLAAEELLDQDRFIFYTLLDSGARQVVLSYPRYEGDRALVASTFIDDLAGIARITVNGPPDEKDLYQNIKNLWLQLGYDIQSGQYESAAQNLQKLLASQPDAAIHGARLLNKISTSWQRIFFDHFSLFEGDLRGQAAIEEQLAQKYGRAVWSVSRIEDYAFCPMRFFLKHFLKIEAMPEIEEELTALERGNAIHTILYRFYSALKDKKQAAEPGLNRDLLFSIAEEVFDQLPYEGLFWQLERQIYFGTDQVPGLLDHFLEYDQELINETGFVPHHFELSFGFNRDAEKDQSSVAKALELVSDNGSLRLNGRIDRIDLDAHGNAMILDYKTGSAASTIKIRQMVEGLRFQLPVYMLALEKLRPEISANYGGYFQVKDADNCRRIDALADSEAFEYPSKKGDAWLPNKKVLDAQGDQISLDALLQQSLKMAIDKVNELQSGSFRHTAHPEDLFCTKYCEYRRVCQKNSAKLLRVGSQS